MPVYISQTFLDLGQPLLSLANISIQLFHIESTGYNYLLYTYYIYINSSTLTLPVTKATTCLELHTANLVGAMYSSIATTTKTSLTSTTFKMFYDPQR